VFDAIGNMPLHPLVIHAVVIGIPLAVLLALLFALPRTRGWARWPLAVVSVGSLAAAFVAKESGESLQRVLQIQPGNPVGDLIVRHSELATQLLVIMAVFAVVALFNVFLVPRGNVDDPTRSGRRVLAVALPVLLVLLSLVAGFWVYRVGDIGSRAVWNPTGTAQFSTAGR